MHLGSAGYIVGALAIAAALYVVLAYNRLVRARSMLQEGWSGIDVQLRRRADLVPNLIETVKGYAAHEHGIFEDLADKRAQSLAANTVTGQIAAEQAMQGALGRLFAVAEAYPALKAEPISDSCRPSSNKSRTRFSWRGATTTGWRAR